MTSFKPGDKVRRTVAHHGVTKTGGIYIVKEHVTRRGDRVIALEEDNSSEVYDENFFELIQFSESQTQSNEYSIF